MSLQKSFYNKQGLLLQINDCFFIKRHVFYGRFRTFRSITTHLYFAKKKLGACSSVPVIAIMFLIVTIFFSSGRP